MSSSFEFPEFFEYPPYFTVQPNPDTQRKQTELWKSLILGWCRHHREFTIRVDDESLVLFRNDRIGRKLPTDARRFFLDALVSAGAARWMDDGAARKSRALIFWQSLGVWVTVLSDWAARNGLEGQVVALCEITGDDEVGVPIPDGFRDAPVEFVALVALELEKKGKGVFVPSDAGRDAGVKFF